MGGKTPVMLAAADAVANSARREKEEIDKWAAKKILGDTITSVTNTAKRILNKNEEESTAETIQSNISHKDKQHNVSETKKIKGGNNVQRSSQESNTMSEKSIGNKEKQHLRSYIGSKMRKGTTAARNFFKNLDKNGRRRKCSSSSRASNTEEEYWLDDLFDKFDLFCGQLFGEDDADYYDDDDTAVTYDSYDIEEKDGILTFTL